MVANCERAHRNLHCILCDAKICQKSSVRIKKNYLKRLRIGRQRFLNAPAREIVRTWPHYPRLSFSGALGPLKVRIPRLKRRSASEGGSV